MVLQGRRGAVVTALDIVSPTSNYVESASQQKSESDDDDETAPSCETQKVCSHRGPALWAQSPGGEHRSVAVGVEAPPLTMIGRIV